MARVVRVIRIHADGDPEKGLCPWQPMTLADEVIEGEPEERFHRFFEAKRSGASQMRVGVWEGTAYTDKMTPYHCDEIMFVAAGSVTITEEDGREETFVTGDCFFMPKGWSGYWKQSDGFKKIHMTVCWS